MTTDATAITLNESDGQSSRRTVTRPCRGQPGRARSPGARDAEARRARAESLGRAGRERAVWRRRRRVGERAQAVLRVRRPAGADDDVVRRLHFNRRRCAGRLEDDARPSPLDLLGGRDLRRVAGREERAAREGPDAKDRGARCRPPGVWPRAGAGSPRGSRLASRDPRRRRSTARRSPAGPAGSGRYGSTSSPATSSASSSAATWLGEVLEIERALLELREVRDAGGNDDHGRGHGKHSLRHRPPRTSPRRAGR